MLGKCSAELGLSWDGNKSNYGVCNEELHRIRNLKDDGRKLLWFFQATTRKGPSTTVKILSE